MKPMDTTHSSTGASSMDRWSACPASVKLSEGMPNKSSAYASEGTAAHELAEKILTGKLNFDQLKHHDASDEMVEAVGVYVEYVTGIWNSLPRHDASRFLVELKFAHPDIHKGFRGTADSVIYDGNEKTLYVTDYKHGSGIPVDAEHNMQLMYYGIGALLTFKVPIMDVVLTIVQPRYSSTEAVKTWRINAMDLLEFKADLEDAIKATEQEDAAIVVGDHCQFCRAKPICPALKSQAEIALREDFKVEKIGSLEPKVLGSLLDSLPAIETWCKGVREFAYDAMKAGKSIPGYKLVPKRATRKWADAVKAENEFRKFINQAVMRDILTEPELKSPAQVEKIIGGSAGKELVAKLTVAVSSGDTLVSDSDPRPETNRLDAAKAMFNQIN